MSATPCPNCHRCPFCGKKLKNQDHCICGYEKDPEYLASFKAKWAIPAHNVPRERRRMEIRKQLEFKRGIAAGLCTVPWIFLILIVRDLIGAETVAAFCGMAVALAIILIGSWWCVDRVFRRIENRRLESEFPSEKSTP
jgi:hypothetical protein